MKKEDFITKLKMSKIQSASDILNSLSTDDVVALWNEYCSTTGNECNTIYHNNQEFFNTDYYFNSNSSTVYDVIKAVSKGDYTITDKYVCFDDYDTLISFNGIDERNSPYLYNELLEWLVDKKTYLVDEKSVQFDIISNYIDWFTSDEDERKRLKESAELYVDEDHALYF